MPIQPGRFSKHRIIQAFVCVVAALGGAALIGLGALGYGDAEAVSSRIWLISAGALSIVFAIVVLTITPLLIKMESTAARQLSELRDLNDLLPQLIAKMESISENTRISDAAKSLAHREEEIDALRKAIRDDVRNEKWDAAELLVREIRDRFGFDTEATTLGAELKQARHDAIETKLSQAVGMVETHFQAKEWDLAEEEIARMRHALPDDLRVNDLHARLENLKNQHKTELRNDWDEAVRKGDTDHAIDVLKQLDVFLTTEEVQELATVARTVFKEKLLQMGIQFRQAVKEKRWQDSLEIGIELVREFPNARMAQEVRDMLAILRERAEAAATPASPEA